MSWQRRFPRSVALVVALCIVGVPAPRCAHQGGCINTVNGVQGRPVLTGNQTNVNDDGTCKYGHAGKDEKCKGGWACGITYFECVCVSSERSSEGTGNARNVKMGGGVVLLLIGIVLSAASAYYVQSRQDPAIKQVVPITSENVVIGKGTHQASGIQEFADPFGGPPTKPSPLDATKPITTKGDRAGDLDGLAIGCLLLPGVGILLGVILIMVAFSTDVSEYYDECTQS